MAKYIRYDKIGFTNPVEPAVLGSFFSYGVVRTTGGASARPQR
jgi:hypothetical protein